MTLSGVIDSFKTGAYTITRQANGSYVNGRLVPGSDSTFTVDAVVVPLTGKDLKILPEALHSRSAYTVMTTTKVGVQTQALHKGDRITIDSDVHTVIKSHDWTAFGETFYEAIAVAEPAAT